ncbi:MAG: hypothetical protein IPL71_08240 [Anaerolineales bacterium]|nr:hypothetical protein [Anaerolineales bacterium]
MLTLADALEAITRNAVRLANATAIITEAAIDSRQVIPGSLFIAIPGENVDGHDYIADAFKRGATFALIQKEVLASFRNPRPACRSNCRIYPRPFPTPLPARGQYHLSPAADRAFLAPQTEFACGWHYRQRW